MLSAATNLNGTEYNGIKIPAKFAPTEINGENSINDGLVIIDSEGNEFVWIEVPKNESIYTSTGIQEIDFETLTDEDLEDVCSKIYNDLRQYTNDYFLIHRITNTASYNWKDEWYDGCGIDSVEEYTQLFYKMLSSIYSNKGFWISRYEVGDAIYTNTNTSRTEDAGCENKAVSMANQIPYTYITCYEAEKLAENFSHGNNRSSLMFGIQQMLLMKYLETKGISYETLTENTTMFGNYMGNTWSIKNEKSKYNANPANSSDSKYDGIYPGWINFSQDLITNNSVGIQLTTGSYQQFKIQNIYDLAGNVWEYTLEHAITFNNMPTSAFGGSRDNSTPVAFRR